MTMTWGWWLVTLFGWTGLQELPALFTEAEQREIDRLSPLPKAPVDETNRFADDPAAARLGQYLFFDPRFSANGEISCATCHDPALGFADGQSLGEGLEVLPRHTPSIWNSAYSRWLFWDGRTDSLWSQAMRPMESAVEMGGHRLQFFQLLQNDAALREAYQQVVGDLPTLEVPAENLGDWAARWETMDPSDQSQVTEVFVNLAKCIAAYERRLVSRNSVFDRFVEGFRRGHKAALSSLSPAAQRGLKTFVGRGNCTLCHHGPTLSDGEFHDIRVPDGDGGEPTDSGRFGGVPTLLADEFNARGPYSDDTGGKAARRLKFLVNSPENWGTFKTPSLRNVARTAPYMHQGQFSTLREVVEYYSTLESARPPGHHGGEQILVPLFLSDEEIDDLVAFLESLTDEEIDPLLRKGPSSPLFIE